jgi:hypothetical protein
MPTRFTIVHRAEQHCEFARDAFDKNLNKEIPIHFENGHSFLGKLVHVEVSEDRTSASLTFEIEDEVWLP